MRRIILGVFCTTVMTMFIVGFFFYWGNIQMMTEADSYALLVKGERDAASQKVLQGVTAAAKDQGATVNLYVWMADIEQELIQMKEEDGIDGLICFWEETDDGENTEGMISLCRQIGLPVIIIGQDEDEDTVSMDNYGAGVQMVKEALRQGAQSIIFLIQQQDRVASRQMEGARSALPKEMVYLEAKYTQEFVPDETWEKLVENGAFILALGNAATDFAIKMKESSRLAQEIPLFGIGRPMEVENLENGTAWVLLYPSYFSLGYHAFQKLNGFYSWNGAQIPYQVITLETLYNSENVSYAFPLLD